MTTDLPTHATAIALETALHAALRPSALSVEDDSASHASHAGAREGSHFSVRVVSESFTGLSRIARHRLVYDALGPLMSRGIHALVLDARAPGEV